MSTMSTEFNVERVLELVSVMPTTDQWTIAESILRGLKKSSKAGKTSKAKKERDPDAPKREPSDWIKHTTHVRQFLDQEHKGVACTQIASMLKEEGKLFADEADVMDAYARWKENPPSKKPKAESVADEASDSEEKGSSTKKERKPRAKMTDEQKAAAKAKREAKKAAKEAEAVESESESESEAESVAPPPKPVTKPAEKQKPVEKQKPAEKPKPVEKQKPAEKPKPVEKAAPAPVAKMAKVMKPKAAPAPVAKVEAKAEVQQEGEFWEHNFGSGVDKYERFPNEAKAGTYYVFHPTEGYMGLWDETDQELDPDVADPTA
jgi:hypothetical protein